ncbi:uncharacterized protein F4807DRAFT_425697 [Annulohypoxylon truncatum]|uniref:uncharacterized protein n=1 Tax=Annulohypoxylon truncatum TaxID=327061 RepID=UPI0020073724|nr:uncharacterized protein F4807DRAFT_425697 [Annulohypoxylon truncatum]KAI1209633.1 hypothetical protein F4807DRAFT_425697 [Annulohypoxylon truncatum]
MDPSMNCLMGFLPRAGMRYPEGNLLVRLQRDRQILSALKRHEIIKTIHSVSKKQNRDAVDQALADMFTTALQTHIIQCQEGWGGAIAVIMTLKRHTPWAAPIHTMPFIHLCCALAKSRHEWHKNPRPPFDISEHRATAKSIDTFLEVVGDDWWDVDHLFFALPEGAKDDSDDEDYEKGKEGKEDENEEAIASPIATSSSNIDPSDNTYMDMSDHSDMDMSDDSDMNMSDVGEALEEDLAKEDLMKGGQAMDLD